MLSTYICASMFYVNTFVFFFHQILEVPSKLFYSGSLKAFATFPPDGPKDMPAVTFIEVAGEERRDEDSPSLYNVFEAEKVVEKVYNYSNLL